MSMIFGRLCLLAGALTVSACATATRGTTEPVNFTSDPSGAKMTTSFGPTCVTPCTIEIERSQTFTAKFELGDQVQEIFVDTEVPDAVAGTTAANVLLTPIILIPVAIAVDAASGANLNHTPNPVFAKFDPVAKENEAPEDPEAPTIEGEVVAAAQPSDSQDDGFKWDDDPATANAAPTTPAAATQAQASAPQDPASTETVTDASDQYGGFTSPGITDESTEAEKKCRPFCS